MLRNAKRLQLWTGVARHDLPAVIPVLVLWGPAQRGMKELPARRHRSGVAVTAGPQLQSWVRELRSDVLTAAQIDGVWSELDRRHSERRDAAEQPDWSMPRSLGELVRRAFGCLVIAMLGFLTSAQLLQWTGLWGWVPAGLALLGGGEVTRRRTRFTCVASAAITGVASTFVLGFTAVLIAALRS